MSCANIGFCCSLHSDKACQGTKKSANNKCNRDRPMRSFAAAAHKSKQERNDQSKIGKNFPFSFQESHSTFSNVLADLFHTVGARVLFGNPEEFYQRIH